MQITQINEQNKLNPAERLLRAQPDSVANHVTALSISERRSLT